MQKLRFHTIHNGYLIHYYERRPGWSRIQVAAALGNQKAEE